VGGEGGGGGGGGGGGTFCACGCRQLMQHVRERSFYHRHRNLQCAGSQSAAWDVLVCGRQLSAGLDHAASGARRRVLQRLQFSILFAMRHP